MRRVAVRTRIKFGVAALRVSPFDFTQGSSRQCWSSSILSNELVGGLRSPLRFNTSGVFQKLEPEALRI